MCAICDLRIEFGVDHPMSLSVAVATRQAIDNRSLLPTVIGAETLAGMPLRQAAIASLKSVQRRLEAVLSPPELRDLPDFFVLMVESGTWAFFRATEAGFDPTCIPDPPRLSADNPTDRAAVIVTSETTLRPMLVGKLSFEQALRQGLIVVDADFARQIPLTQAWSASFPVRGFSRFVCTSWVSEPEPVA